ncbi:DNA primase small subunit [Thermofilum pendens Hrk 5]|uniref:DNA primase small subunit PriS n=1 Tax=Thermofilum pendens (strain DSM 2475 / Hrk 5) TaxID=368408 RepID=A1RXU6_THEPD|nr:DNA primase small subunit [Thermofilum pendens Hrk 5]
MHRASQSSAKSDMALIRGLFARYYARTSVEAPSELSKREFAFSMFNSTSMIRHLSFSTREELDDYIRVNVPQHAYYSSAYYQYPSAQEMGEKGWLGADLVFDIDVDHIPTPCKDLHDRWRCQDCGAEGWGFTKKCPSCGSERLEWSKWVCSTCINVAREEMIKLVEILEDDFGFDRAEMRVAFSGHRGFHLHVESEAVKDLDQDARREITDYVRGIGIDVKLYLKPAGKSLYTYKYSATSPGWAGRIAKYLLLRLLQAGENGELESLSMEYEQWEKTIKEAVSELSVKVDEKVTIDTKRLIRLPGSLHGKTGLKVFSMSVNELENLDSDSILKRAIVFPDEKVQVAIEKPPRKVLYYSLEKVEEGKLEVPLFLAVYMVLNGKARLLNFR